MHYAFYASRGEEQTNFIQIRLEVGLQLVLGFKLCLHLIWTKTRSNKFRYYLKNLTNTSITFEGYVEMCHHSETMVTRYYVSLKWDVNVWFEVFKTQESFQTYMIISDTFNLLVPGLRTTAICLFLSI
jgi:hypothetical protein